MNDLLWTCADGREFSSETNGLRLVVTRADRNDGFRFEVIRKPSLTAGANSMASGHRGELRDAITAAERAAAGFRPRPLQATHEPR